MPTVYVTAPRDAAESLARTLVEAELAACVNRVDCTSTYRWEGEVHVDDEAVLFVKTSDGAYERLKERIREAHPHEVPCIERIDETDVLAPYAEWVRESVSE
jgi:periplasmic divalent cation tolerance protein